METRTAAVAAALLCLAAIPSPARASQNGILACQISLSEFADDVVASKTRLTTQQLAAARNVVDVGRGQCRSSPQIVLADIRAARTALPVHSSGHATYAFSDSWPPLPQEMASLSR